MMSCPCADIIKIEKIIKIRILLLTFVEKAEDRDRKGDNKMERKLRRLKDGEIEYY